MKQIRSQLAILLLIAFAIGCTTVYTGTVTITKTVDAAMKMWADLSVAGKTSPAIDAAVTRAHDRYRESCGVAQKAFMAYKVSGDPAKYQEAVSLCKAAAMDVLNILTPLLTQTQAQTLTKQIATAKTL